MQVAVSGRVSWLKELLLLLVVDWLGIMHGLVLEVLLGGLLSIGLFYPSLLVCADSFLLHTLRHRLGAPRNSPR